MSKWVDTHFHFSDRNEVNAQAKEIQEQLAFGVTIGTTVEDNYLIADWAESYSNLFGTVGIHPLHVDEWGPAFGDLMKKLYISSDKIVGVGEIGLDYHYEGYDPIEQKKAFEAQLDIATELNAPVVIHGRDSTFDCLEILKNYPRLKNVVFHCFTGNMKEAMAIIDHGYHMSFTGVITFPKSQELRDIVKIVPLNRLLVETDAPYLTPVPFRGKVNRPIYVSYVGEAMGEIFNKTKEEMATITTQNAREFFHITNY